MTNLERARGGKDIQDRLRLSNNAYLWLTHQENPLTIKKIEQASKLISKLFEGQNVEITQFMDSPDDQINHDSARIEVSGRDIFVNDTAVFAQLGKICSSISFSPRITEQVTVYFNFDKLYQKVSA